MALRPTTSAQPSAAHRDDATNAWEHNDYLDFMAAVLLGVVLTALIFSVM